VVVEVDGGADGLGPRAVEDDDGAVAHKEPRKGGDDWGSIAGGEVVGAFHFRFSVFTARSGGQENGDCVLRGAGLGCL
jgi:hypothetical protein